MISIEGIPIVAARLAAMQKSTKAPQPSRPSRSHRTLKKQFRVASQTKRARRRRAIGQISE